MSNVNLITWFQFGRPAAGAITSRGRVQHNAHDGCEPVSLIEKYFGEPQDLKVVDLGAGAGDSPMSRRILDAPWKKLVSVEAFIPSIHQLQSRTALASEHEILEGHIETVVNDLRKHEMDVALLIDSIGHLSRADSLKTLRHLEKVIRRGIVIYTPIGRYRSADRELNALLQQRSIWKPADFSKLGYTVTILEGHYARAEPPINAIWAVKTLNANPELKTA